MNKPTAKYVVGDIVRVARPLWNQSFSEVISVLYDESNATHIYNVKLENSIIISDLPESDINLIT